MDQAKVAAQLQNPHILKIFGIGKVEQTYYISYEFTEGKSLEGHPRPLPSGSVSPPDRARAPHREQGLLGARVRPRPQERSRPLLPRVPDPGVRSSYPTRARSALKGFGYWPSRVQGGLAPRGRSATWPRSSAAVPASPLRPLRTGRDPLRGADRQRPQAGGGGGADRGRAAREPAGRRRFHPRPGGGDPAAVAREPIPPRAIPTSRTCARPSTPCSSRGTSRPPPSTSRSSCTRSTARTSSGRPSGSRKIARPATSSS